MHVAQMAVFGGDEESAVMQTEVHECRPADERAQRLAALGAVQRERLSVILELRDHAARDSERATVSLQSDKSLISSNAREPSQFATFPANVRRFRLNSEFARDPARERRPHCRSEYRPQ